jgi:hypothetical protein
MNDHRETPPSRASRPPSAPGAAGAGMGDGGCGGQRHAVTAEEAGLRLDVFLAKKEPALSRARVQKAIDEGAVLVTAARCGEPQGQGGPGGPYPSSRGPSLRGRA